MAHCAPRTPSPSTTAAMIVLPQTALALKLPIKHEAGGWGGGGGLNISERKGEWGGGGGWHIPPHPAQPQHTNHGAPRTRKRHQQEHRPQRPTESSDPTQHAEGRTGDCPGPRKETATRRNVTRGGAHMSQNDLPVITLRHATWGPLDVGLTPSHRRALDTLTLRRRPREARGCSATPSEHKALQWHCDRRVSLRREKEPVGRDLRARSTIFNGTNRHNRHNRHNRQPSPVLRERSSRRHVWRVTRRCSPPPPLCLRGQTGAHAQR